LLTYKSLLGGFMLFGGNHLGYQLLQSCGGRPAQLLAGFAGIVEQYFYLGGAEIARVNPHRHCPSVVEDSHFLQSLSLPAQLFQALLGCACSITRTRLVLWVIRACC